MISISPSAASQLRGMLSERLRSPVAPDSVPVPSLGLEAGPAPATGRTGLRIFVEKGGCAGMQYEMRLDVSGPQDTVVESEGAFVIVDPESARFLEGACLDYCDDLVGTGFRLRNPNAARSCGCGTSFEPLGSMGSEGRSGEGMEREATGATPL